MSDDKDSEIAALKARLEALERQPSSPPGPSAPLPARPTKKSGCGTAIIATCVIGGALIMIAQCSSSLGSSSSTDSAYEPTAPSWSPPEGYSLERTRSGGVGYKWSDATNSECRGSGVRCWAVDVVTEKGCPRSLYMSISLFNSSGQNVGWTNDTAQGVGPGESVRLVFDTYERGARTARVAEVSCY